MEAVVIAFCEAVGMWRAFCPARPDVAPGYGDTRPEALRGIEGRLR